MLHTFLVPLDMYVSGLQTNSDQHFGQKLDSDEVQQMGRNAHARLPKVMYCDRDCEMTETDLLKLEALGLASLQLLQ